MDGSKSRDECDSGPAPGQADRLRSQTYERGRATNVFPAEQRDDHNTRVSAVLRATLVAGASSADLSESRHANKDRVATDKSGVTDKTKVSVPNLHVLKVAESQYKGSPSQHSDARTQKV